MIEKSWKLNPQATRWAKACADVVEQELNVELHLSHPDFLNILHEYVDSAESDNLRMAYSRLVAVAGPGTILQNLTKNSVSSATHPLDDQCIDENFSTEGFASVGGRRKTH